jgi:hypothetical protein
VRVAAHRNCRPELSNTPGDSFSRSPSVPKTYGEITERLLKLAVGRSCVVSAPHPHRYIKTVRKYAPETAWSVESVEGGRVVTRVR